METSEALSVRERVALIRANTISATSRRSYRATWSALVQWMLQHKRNLIPIPFVEQLHDPSRTRKAILAAIDADVDHTRPPLDFERLQAADFVEWLLTLRKRDGKPPGFSTFNNHRAALFNLFREYRCLMSNELQTELTTYFRGLKRSTAEQAANGDVAVKVGKDPLSLEMYEFICTQMLKSSSKDMVFAHAFLVISWNLMCRSANTVGIMTSHIEWRDDSFCVFFAHMKNDQTGSRPRDPRHIYANPLRPSICPLLALGIYWAVFAVDQDRLFPGSAQYDRFRKLLHAFLEEDAVKAELFRRGVDSNDIGTHSIRKGSATYCSSGSTACPSSTAVHLRAGWSLGGVQNTYLRYQGAGDMHVGRTVSGLPPNSELFASLPPRFDYNDELVKLGIKTAFGDVPLNLRFVCEHALAALAYHSDYLIATLPAAHPLFQTPIFQTGDRLKQLRDRVRVGIASDDPTQIASGVPPHCAMLGRLRSVEQELQALRSTVVEQVVEGVVSAIDGQSHSSAAVVKRAIIASFQELGLVGLVEQVRVGCQPDTQSSPTPDESTIFLYTWGGRYRRLPEDYQLHDGTPRQMWVLWTCGGTKPSVPPLRHVQPSDLSSANSRKRLSDLRFLMSRLESAARGHPAWSARNVDVETACRVYDEVSETIALSDLTGKQRKRRHSQLGWRTVVNELRKRQRQVHDNQ